MQNLMYLARLPCTFYGAISSKSYCVMNQCMKQSLFKPKLPLTSIHGTILRSSSSRISVAIEERLKRGDKVPANYKIIYRAPMYNYFLATHGFVVGGPLLMCVGCLFSYVEGGSFPIDLEFITWFTGFLVLNFAMFRILSLYVLRIYCDENGSYILVKNGYFPFQVSKSSLSEGDLMRLEPKGHMPWKFNRFIANGEKSIILEHYFRKPSDFNAMLSKKNAEVSSD